MSYQTIPGIYNYCNRWCERCPLGHRCMVNMMERQMFAEPELPEESEEVEAEPAPAEDSEDRSQPVENFEIAEPTPEEMEEYARQRKEMRARVEVHPAVRQAKQAGDCVALVVERYFQLTKDAEETPAEGLSWRQQQIVEGEQHRLQNFVDVLRWYRYPLQVKTHRAVNGLLEDDFEDEDPVQNDWNGTAKLVGVFASHCEKAGRGLLEKFPALEDELLLLLKSLQELQQELHQTFPRASEFIRPGFDTLGISEDLGL